MSDYKLEHGHEPTDSYQSGALAFPAFSGLGEHINRCSCTLLANVGPIPPGTYYVFGPRSDGLLGPFLNLFKDRNAWFALHSIDDNRSLGTNYGYVVMQKPARRTPLHALLKGSPTVVVPGLEVKAYGMVVVK